MHEYALATTMQAAIPVNLSCLAFLVHQKDPAKTSRDLLASFIPGSEH